MGRCFFCQHTHGHSRLGSGVGRKGQTLVWCSYPRCREQPDVIERTIGRSFHGARRGTATASWESAQLLRQCTRGDTDPASLPPHSPSPVGDILMYIMYDGGGGGQTFLPSLHSLVVMAGRRGAPAAVGPGNDPPAGRQRRRAAGLQKSLRTERAAAARGPRPCDPRHGKERKTKKKTGRSLYPPRCPQQAPFILPFK